MKNTAAKITKDYALEILVDIVNEFPGVGPYVYSKAIELENREKYKTERIVALKKEINFCNTNLNGLANERYYLLNKITLLKNDINKLTNQRLTVDKHINAVKEKLSNLVAELNELTTDKE